MYKKVVLVMCVVLMSSAAMAQLWVGGAHGDWNNPANWGGAVPAAGGSPETGMVLSDVTPAAMPYYMDWRYGGPDPVGTPVNPNAAMLMTMFMPSPLGWTNQTIETYATDVIPGLANLSLAAHGDDRFTRATLNIRTNIAVSNEFALSPGDYGYSTVNQYSGDVNVAGSIRIPRRYTGIYNIYGGTMTAKEIFMPRNGSGWAFNNYLGDIYFDDTVGDKSDPPDGIPDGLFPDDGIVNPTYHTTVDGYFPKNLAQSRLNIWGGVVTTQNLSLPSGNLPNGKVMMAGGTLVLNADPVNMFDLATLIATVNTKMANGQIFAADPDQPLIVSVNDLGEGYGSVTITPEPATMIMLGLGALGLIRRKK